MSIFLFRLFLSSSLVSILRFVDACLVLIIFVPRPNRAHRITRQRYDVALAERCGAHSRHYLVFGSRIFPDYFMCHIIASPATEGRCRYIYVARLSS